MTSAMEIGLILQGGGALGAYEWGGILALFDLMDEAARAGRNVTLRVVTGVSIGAINAACVVGASGRDDARQRLGALWNDFMIKAPAFVPAAVTSNVALFEVPHFYRFAPSWNFTYLYQTKALLDTLSEHVDFAALNASGTAFVVTAVDVKSGQLTWFANQSVGEIAPRTIEPRHVLASGSLAPQFPWTQIGDGKEAYHYWDGGLIDNTPLGAAIDALDPNPNVGKLLVVMNLFPLQTNLPNTYTEVSQRVDQLRFGNRLRQDASTARQFNKLISVIERLAALVPQLPPDVNELLANYKIVEPIEISLGPADSLSDPYGFHDFSQQGIEARRDRGKAITAAKLRPFFADKIAA
ncbi:MAG: patatin-like phospholipase family protein [Xanthobacteraceae bacterium]